jgi:hypothetical protein
MDNFPGSDYSSVYHDETGNGNARDGADYGAYASVIGEAPRLFALVRPLYDISDDILEDSDAVPVEPDAELIAYGVALPDGTATTFTIRGRSFGKWRNPDRAAMRLYSELVWL